VSRPAHLAPQGDGTTPLSPDELDGLRLTWVTTRGQVLEQEAKGLQRVALDHLRRVPALSTMLDDVWVRRLHYRIFGHVWAWAGKYRRSGKSIGVDWMQVPVAVRNLVADAAAWFEHDDVDRAAARLHHRLVEVHPFPDGNGRHARMYTDLCLRAAGVAPFSWGRHRPEPDADKRTAYLAALRVADRTRDISDLAAYCRT
jgi:Fic-DOC domain mobile mystery protein B